jgi:hypothetical protein
VVPNLSLAIPQHTLDEEINAVLDTPRTPDVSQFRARKPSTTAGRPPLPPSLDVESLKRQIENIPEECFTIE